MTSSNMPSAKYSCSGSPLMLANGSTAIGAGRWHQLFSLFRLLTLIFEAAWRVPLLGRLGCRFLQCRRALGHVFEMALVRHRLDEEVAHRPDQRIDPVW